MARVILTFIVTFLSFCKTEQADNLSKKPILAGDIKKVLVDTTTISIDKPKDALIVYYDNVGDFNVLSKETIKLQGDLDLDYYEISAQLNDVHSMFFIRLNDSVNIKLEQGKFNAYSKKSSTQEINFFSNYVFEKKIEKVINKPDFAIDIKNLDAGLKKKEAILKEELSAKLSYLAEYRKKYNLSDEFFRLWKDYFTYSMIEKKMFIVPNILATKNLPDWFRDELTICLPLFQRDDLLYLREYQNASRLLLYYLELRSNDFKEPSPELSLKLIKDNFTGFTKDYLLLMLYKKISEKKSFQSTAYESIKSDIVNACQEGIYKDYINKMATKPNTVLSSGDNLTNIHNNQVQLNDIYKRKKLTYIDFWASWCAPCRAEMPSSKKLKSEYINQDIQFIYVSMDENWAAWDRAVKQLGLLESESFILTKSSSLPKKFKIKEIPRYILIDTDGNVVDANAPRPSDPALRDLFNKALKK